MIALPTFHDLRAASLLKGELGMSTGDEHQLSGKDSLTFEENGKPPALLTCWGRWREQQFPHFPEDAQPVPFMTLSQTMCRSGERMVKQSLM
jgi:hypothetical protein